MSLSIGRNASLPTGRVRPRTRGYQAFQRLLIGIVGALLCSSGVVPAVRAVGQSGGTDRVVDEVVAIAARSGSIWHFAQSLAAERIPVGLLLGHEDDRPSRATRPSQTGRSVTLGHALSELSRSRPRYGVSESSGVILIAADSAAQCGPLLSRRVVDLQATAPAFAMVFEIEKAIDPRLSALPPAGLVNGSPIFRTPVAINGAGRTVLELLNEISRQVPGLGWALAPARRVERGLPPTFGSSPSDFDGRHCVIRLFSAEAVLSGGQRVAVR